MPFTADTIDRTRRHFADLDQACIDDAESGRVRVNDLPAYVEWMRDSIRAGLAGEYDHTFTFRQMAHYLETGDCVPLFAPAREAVA